MLEYEDQQPALKQDAGTVVGKVARSEQKLEERAVPVSRKNGAAVKAVPAVRALARKLDVDLSLVSPSGPGERKGPAPLESSLRRLSLSPCPWGKRHKRYVVR